MRFKGRNFLFLSLPRFCFIFRFKKVKREEKGTFRWGQVSASQFDRCSPEIFEVTDLEKHRDGHAESWLLCKDTRERVSWPEAQGSPTVPRTVITGTNGLSQGGH